MSLRGPTKYPIAPPPPGYPPEPVLGLANRSTDELVRELRARGYRVIHKDRIRTVYAEYAFAKHELEVMEEAAETVVRSQLAYGIGHLLTKGHPMREFPEETKVRYRMEFTTIGPQVSPHTEEYWHLCTRDPSRPTSG